MRKVLEIGGLVAGLILIVFGVVAIVMGMNGRSTVSSSLKDQQIVGTSDMTPAGDHGRRQGGGVEERQASRPAVLPDKPINSGSQARCFAEYMQIHALEATGGFLYSQMGIWRREAGNAQGAADAGWRHRRRRRPPRSTRPRSSPCPTAPATCG